MIVEPGDALHLELVAEGVELAEQVTALQAVGCRFGQGYLFAESLDAETFRRRVSCGATMPGPSPASAMRFRPGLVVPRLRFSWS